MLWLLPLAVCLTGLLALAVLAHRVRREAAPTAVLVDRFGREHRVARHEARARLHDATAETRRRLSRG